MVVYSANPATKEVENKNCKTIGIAKFLKQSDIPDVVVISFKALVSFELFSCELPWSIYQVDIDMGELDFRPEGWLIYPKFPV